MGKINNNLKANSRKLLTSIILIFGGIALLYFSNDDAYITSVFPSEYIKHTNISFILLGITQLFLCFFSKDKSDNKILSLIEIFYSPILFTGITFGVNVLVFRFIPNGYLSCISGWVLSALILFTSSFLHYWLFKFITKDLQSDKDDGIDNNQGIDNKNSQEKEIETQ
ncbi:hypothetical protein BKK49_08945 [Rodentibacter rarus]|uniref:Uncharacterized protein n=1 Tax=Rodentibacter rarus TaxID=1908260 RepID=A0A1V3IEV1_9PAST|nr:hypothetical protein [Rodentibacter rarus]OOF38934.1 hypothetical protein BKK49_08945 [Rodentibacter rarus]OOF39264.1 hypothetical protein BKK50_10735 [Rodentibacter rarus]